MYSDEEDFREVFPDLDCDNLPEDDTLDKKPDTGSSDKPDGEPDPKPNSDKDDEEKKDKDETDHDIGPESHLNFEPHNSNIQNFINYNTDFETKINFNLGNTFSPTDTFNEYILGGAKEQEKDDHKVEDFPIASEPCPEITMQGIFQFY